MYADPYDVLTLTVDEYWWIADYVRQHDKLGQEWDQGFQLRLYRGLLEAQRQPPTAPLTITLPELWQIDRQLNSGMMKGPLPIGLTILTKVRTLIVKLASELGEEELSYDHPDRHQPADYHARDHGA